jgi:hypothetical protein
VAAVSSGLGAASSSRRGSQTLPFRPRRRDFGGSAVKEPESSPAAVGRLVSSWPAALEVEPPVGMYVRSRLAVLGSWGRARPAEGKPARSSDVRGLGPASRDGWRGRLHGG